MTVPWQHDNKDHAKAVVCLGMVFVVLTIHGMARGVPLGGFVVKASQYAGESTGAVFDPLFDPGQTSTPGTDDPDKSRRS
jgi:hypothetical protein